MKLSIIIPVLNERENIKKSLPTLQWARRLGHEIIVVDGGSDDDSAAEAEQFADLVIFSSSGRAHQMNAGAQQARGDVFIFLHVDTLLREECITRLCDKMLSRETVWGRFDVRLSGKHVLFRIIEMMMNWRSRLTGIATGDQAIFVAKNTFHSIAGFAEIPLMEDIEICRRLNALKKPLCLYAKVVTSSRRWEKNGILATIILMWRLRLAYWQGADPRMLAKQYHG